MRRFLVHALILASGMMGGFLVSLAGTVPRLNGTFIQLLKKHGSWTPDQWKQLFVWLRSAGIDHLIVQWSVFNEEAFYPSAAFQGVPNAPLETILTLADSSRMSVLIGLVYDEAYWSNIQGDAAAVSPYLHGLRSRSVQAARELAPILQRHSSAEGWYISGEIDDVNWRSPEKRELLFDYAGSLGRDLRSLRPGMAVAISAFSQAQSSPDGFRQFWDEFLQRAPVDRVLFQDGVGVNKLDVREVPIYAGALQDAARKNNRSLRMVVELFQQVAGPPIDDAAFRAVPGPWDRIRSQIEMAGKYSPGEIIGFSVPEYMTPLAGEAGRSLLAQYQNQFRNNLDPSAGR